MHNGGEIYRADDGLGRPEVEHIEEIDVVAMYENSVDESNERAYDLSKMLDVLVTDFFKKIGIPVRMQIPITFIRGGVLIMKGLLFSDEMRTAFSKAPPEVLLVMPHGGFSEEVRVNFGFFESVVFGEIVGARDGVRAGVGEVIEG